ncbi:MAG: hypothetical protein AABZ74_07805 [Cyanobacteriota bacterium]
MSLITIETNELKDLIDERIKEIFSSDKEAFYELFYEIIENNVFKKSIKEAKSKKKKLSNTIAEDFREAFNEIEEIKLGKRKPKLARDFLNEI